MTILPVCERHVQPGTLAVPGMSESAARVCSPRHGGSWEYRRALILAGRGKASPSEPMTRQSAVNRPSLLKLPWINIVYSLASILRSQLLFGSSTVFTTTHADLKQLKRTGIRSIYVDLLKLFLINKTLRKFIRINKIINPTGWNTFSYHRRTDLTKKNIVSMKNCVISAPVISSICDISAHRRVLENNSLHMTGNGSFTILVEAVNRWEGFK